MIMDEKIWGILKEKTPTIDKISLIVELSGGTTIGQLLNYFPHVPLHDALIILEKDGKIIIKNGNEISLK